MRSNKNKFLYTFALVIIASVTSQCQAGLVTVGGGTLSMNFDGNAFANQANLDPDNWGFLTPTAGQDLLRFGKAWAPNATVGLAPTYSPLPTTAFRPEAGVGPAPRTPNFRDNRAYMEATYPNVSPTVNFSVNSSQTVLNSEGANRQKSTLSWDSADALNTLTGKVQSNGVAAWWFANNAIVNQNVAWVSFGQFDFMYDATRVNYKGLGYSGWRFENQLGGEGGLFDTVFTSVTTDSSGNMTINGDLYGNDDGTLGFYVGLKPDVKYGTFSLNVTAVPEPSSMILLGLTGLSALGVRRVRGKKSSAIPSADSHA